MDDVIKKDLDKRFDYHKPGKSQPEKYTVIRGSLKENAELIIETCPDSRERSLAITKLEEAMFWANASIARHE